MGEGIAVLKRFYPKLYRPSVYEIDYGELLNNGIKYLLIDIDNTLAPHDIPEPDEKILNFFKDLGEKGFTVCLISNNKPARVELFNKSLGLHAVPKAGKPKKRAILRALELMNGVAAETALIGDQLFTDVWCGNRTGLYSILVKPICARDEWTVRLKRLPEKIVFRFYLSGERKKDVNDADIIL